MGNVNDHLKGARVTSVQRAGRPRNVLAEGFPGWGSADEAAYLHPPESAV